MSEQKSKEKRSSYTEYTLDMFSRSSGKNHAEIKQFNQRLPFLLHRQPRENVLHPLKLKRHIS